MIVATMRTQNAITSIMAWAHATRVPVQRGVIDGRELGGAAVPIQDGDHGRRHQSRGKQLLNKQALFALENQKQVWLPKIATLSGSAKTEVLNWETTTTVILVADLWSPHNFKLGGATLVRQDTGAQLAPDPMIIEVGLLCGPTVATRQLPGNSTKTESTKEDSAMPASQDATEEG